MDTPRFEKKELNSEDYKNVERAAAILRVFLLPIVVIVSFPFVCLYKLWNWTLNGLEEIGYDLTGKHH